MATVAELQVRVGADTSQAETGLRRVGAEVDNTAKKSGVLGNAFGGLGNIASVAIGQVVASAFMKASAAAVGFFGSTISTAADFQATMSGIAAVLAPTTAEMEALRQKALQLGADTAFSASEAGMAIEALAQNGLNAAQIMGGAADATVALAAATKTDLTTAATIATDTMAAFGLQAGDMMAAVDGITGVTVASKFGIDDYRLALANGGGAASAFGVSLEDFNAVIAATSSQFTSGQTAGTAFRTFVNKLTPSTDEATAAMSELGLMTANGASAFYTATGAIRPMTEVAGLLQGALGGLTDAQKAMAIETIFGQEAIGTVIGLMQQGSAGVTQFAADIAKVDAAAQAATRLDNFNGTLEAFSGSLDTLKIIIGTAVLPVLTSLVQWLTNVINIFADMATAITSAANPFQEFANQVSVAISSLLGLSTEANSYGAGLVQAFADGIASAFSAVVGVLQQIGSIVSYWLQPNSPPKIVPNLDQYGAGAATVYFEGWRDGDYSALQDIGGIITSTLSGLVDTGMFAEQDVIPRVLGTQGAMRDAIDQLRETGSVSQELIDNIVAGAGPVGDTIRGFVTSYFDLESATKAVKDAQDELNRVQDEYNAKLEPLNSELDLIQQKKKALQDAQRIEKLNEKIADGKTTDSERAIALLEIEEIKKRQQIDTVNAEKDAAIDSAQAKLDAAKKNEDAAKENLATQKAAIAATNAQNQMIGQQTQLLERLAKANASGGGGGGISAPKMPAGGLGGLKPPDLSASVGNAIKPLTELGTAVDDIKQRFINFKDGVVESVEGVRASVSGVATTAQGAFGAFSGVLASISSTVMGVFGTIQAYIPAVMYSLQSVIGSVLGVIQTFWNTNGSSIMSSVTTAWGLISSIISGATTLILNIVVGTWTLVAEFIKTHQDSIVTILSGTWEIIKSVITIALTFIDGVIKTALAIMDGDWATAWGTIQTTCATIVTEIGNAIMGFLNIIAGFMGTSMSEIGTTWSTNWDKFLTVANTIISSVVTSVTTFVTDITARFNEILTAAQTIWADIKSAITTTIEDVKTFIGEKVGEIKTKATEIGTNIVDGIKKGINDGWEALKGFVSQKATELLNAAKSTLGIQSPSKMFKDLVGAMIPLGIRDGINTTAGAAINAVKALSSKMLAEAFNLQAQFLRAKAQAKISVEDLMPLDDKKFKAIESRIHQLQQNIALGKDVAKSIPRLEAALALRAEMVAAAAKAQEQLNQAERESNELRQTDPGLANEYYDLRVKQILELAKLEEQKQKAKKNLDKERIQAQIDLLKAAQDAELEAFEAHIQEVKDALAKQVLDTIKEIADRVNNLMRESLSGIAGLARGRAGAKRAIQDMMPDSSALDDMKSKMKELADEEAQLRITASNNIDPEKRADAERRLLEIAKERAELDKEFTFEAQKQRLQTAAAQRAQEELAKAEQEALRLRAIDPKLADEYYALKSAQILEMAQLEQELAGAKTQTEADAIKEQMRLIKEAQDAELKLFNDDAAKRKKELEELAKDAADATTDIGAQFVQAMKDGLAAFTGGLSAFFGGIGIALPQSDTASSAGTPPFGYDPNSGIGGVGTKNGLAGNSGTQAPLIGTLSIDARGSTMTEAKIRQIATDAFNEAARKAGLRRATA